ncbi:MAG: DegT/DnrJ/EryC1/StrS family aminotransferase, partial [Deltaproteobacteria bacterium]|nr:DegT/DnrJ/EryC1/StrS family aminotransferase [Deltaproteobacteria bacterium]
GRPCGSFGDVAILSFHPRKLVTTGQGGAVLTDNDEIAMRVREYRDSNVHSDSFRKVGFDLRPHEMGCAMGAVQMDRLDALLAERRELASCYDFLPFVRQRVINNGTTNFQSMVALLPKEEGNWPAESCQRADFVSFMASQGIEAQPGSYDLSQLAWVKRGTPPEGDGVPNSTLLQRRAVALPIHCGLSGDDVKRVVEACNRWLHRRGG